MKAYDISFLSEVVDDSRESLHHPDEESDPALRKGIPVLKSFRIVDVRKECPCKKVLIKSM